LRDAQGNIERFRKAYQLAQSAKAEGPDLLGENLSDLYDRTLEALCNDLNTPVALAKALEGAKLIAREGDSMSAASGASALKFLARINDLLGIVKSEDQNGTYVPKSATAKVDRLLIEAKIAERAEAKRAKDFARADAIRQELDAMGIELRDSPTGTEWVVKSSI
jgi:cysteinyl-tRNA synthetase